MASASQSGKGRSILLVDDEPDVLQSVGGVLEDGIPGLEVVTASSGNAALAILDRRPVDLIVSDFRMPNMDGLEFLYQCGLRHPRIPRAILTAFVADDLARRAKPGTDVAAYLSKSAEPGILLDWVRRRLASIPASAVASLAKAGLPGARLTAK
jgi:CheY-like chemotaxis protein